MLRKMFVIIVACLFLAGCSGTLTGRVVDEQGCGRFEKWCDGFGRCIDPWQEYCPKEGEQTRLITAHECELGLKGRPVDHGNGAKCASGERVMGEIAGLLSLHVCCVPFSE